MQGPHLVWRNRLGPHLVRSTHFNINKSNCSWYQYLFKIETAGLDGNSQRNYFHQKAFSKVQILIRYDFLFIAIIKQIEKAL